MVAGQKITRMRGSGLTIALYDRCQHFMTTYKKILIYLLPEVFCGTYNTLNTFSAGALSRTLQVEPTTLNLLVGWGGPDTPFPVA